MLEPKIEFRQLTKPSPARPSELSQVREVAGELRSFLDLEATQQRLGETHVVGASSALIQAIMLDEAQRLGFQSERKGLFASYASGIRPDYFKDVDKSGILMEIERGKTLDNNMDVLDLWECHVCPEADYLFLVVPKLRPTSGGTDKAIFTRVANRLGTFFQPQNLVNVEAVFLFGY